MTRKDQGLRDGILLLLGPWFLLGLFARVVGWVLGVVAATVMVLLLLGWFLLAR
jgi:hypothetical protein